MVLTDLEMPEMDGFTLTSQIKKSSRLSQLPVLIHSSLSGTTNEDWSKKSVPTAMSPNSSPPNWPMPFVKHWPKIR